MGCSEAEVIFSGCLKISWTDPPVCVCDECPPGRETSRAWAAKGPVKILCHKDLSLLEISAVNFYGNLSALEGYLHEPPRHFIETGSLPASQSLLSRNWFSPSQSIVAVVGSFGYSPHSTFLAFLVVRS